MFEDEINELINFAKNVLFFFACNGDHQDLHSFPTRRSSDLNENGKRVAGHTAAQSFYFITQNQNAQDSLFTGTYTDIAELTQIPGQVAVDPVMEVCSINIDVDRKSTRLNSSHANISYAVFCL